VARKQIELAAWVLADHNETQEVFITLVDLDVGSLGSTENVLRSMSAGIAEIAFLLQVFRSSSPLTGVRNTLLLT
jgi:hypothetical protein